MEKKKIGKYGGRRMGRKIVNKKIIIVIIIAVMLSSSVLAATNLNKWVSSKDSSVIDEAGYPIYVNGTKLDMVDDDTGKQQVVLNYEGRTYVPLRKIAESVNADSSKMWDGNSVNIITPEHSKPTDFIQVNILPNGGSVKTALETTADITTTAKDAVKYAITKEDKAKKLYQFVIDYMEYYDTGKVGAKPAFYSRKGICYDYATLYMVMCDAVGLNVRLKLGVTVFDNEVGLHAWNEVQTDNGTWKNVDCTWGESEPNFGFKECDIEKDGEVDGGRYPTQLVAEFENY